MSIPKPANWQLKAIDLVVIINCVCVCGRGGGQVRMRGRERGCLYLRKNTSFLYLLTPIIVSYRIIYSILYTPLL